MPLRVGILSVAHVHTWSYVSCVRDHPDAQIVGIWDDNVERAKKFSAESGIPYVASLDALLNDVDAVVITSENTRHAPLVEAAAAKNKHILCEKPLATSHSDVARLRAATQASTGKFMTAFPCRFSPAFQRLKERVKAGEIGKIRAICATNRGRCPFDWFVEKKLSGGGAMIDHVVHVTDLLRDLLGENPVKVQAQTGNNMYGKDWDDTAMLTIEFPSGIFASLDSSWSRPQSYKTWGDVTLNVVGENGVIELDMFGQAVDSFHDGDVTHTMAGYGTNTDATMVDGFIRACLDGTEPPVTLEDGIQASLVAIHGYESAAKTEVVSV